MRDDKVRRAEEGSIDDPAQKAGASGSSIRPTKRPAAQASGEDDLTRFVREIARQAAREAFNLFREEMPSAPAGPQRGSPELEIRPDKVSKANPSPEPGERFFKVADVAVRLAISQKTVRRMIDRGDLRAQQVGRLLRIRARDLETISTRQTDTVE
jgi:excisionase family DNA binding protein